jgi:hypothetical protein
VLVVKKAGMHGIGLSQFSELTSDIAENPVPKQVNGSNKVNEEDKVDEVDNCDSKSHTFVMSVVAVSISFSSALRSVKPGRACLA